MFAVVGAGWAGCAAAVELARRGQRVALFESSRQLGGRARALLADQVCTTRAPADQWHAGLDNGQHIMLGAYSDTLRIMRAVGIDLEASFLRVPLQMRYPAGSGGMDFVCAKLPAPLHLLTALVRASGLMRADKLGLARFTTAARWIDWRLNEDCSVSQLLERFDQTPRAVALLWRPLCLAALNTPPDRASAQVFLNVLRDSLGARRAASDMLIPRVDLSTLFPKPAGRFIAQHGGSVHTGARVLGLRRESNGWCLIHSTNNGVGGHSHGNPETGGGYDQDAIYDAVILATPANETTRLLTGHGAEVGVPLMQEAIVTCYLQYPPTVALPRPFHPLLDEPVRQEWGQFVFDRGQLDPSRRGQLAVVVSAAADAAALGQDQLVPAITEQLARAFGNPVLREPFATKIIAEKRATFACTPGLVRPGCLTGIDGILRAGDYVASDYPATIEGAVRSGITAARMLDRH